jgi:hypothetical protein
VNAVGKRAHATYAHRSIRSAQSRNRVKSRRRRQTNPQKCANPISSAGVPQNVSIRHRK